MPLIEGRSLYTWMLLSLAELHRVSNSSVSQPMRKRPLLVAVVEYNLADKRGHSRGWHLGSLALERLDTQLSGQLSRRARQVSGSLAWT